jgi:predicted peroxiredoxin
MGNKIFSVNIDDDAVKNQYEQEQKQPQPKKTQFDTKNYLQARLRANEDSKTLTIRLLPFSPEGGSPFKKVFMHTVKVNKEVSPSGWKTFVCPTHNKKDGNVMGEKCPFCETSAKARELKSKSLDEPTKKKYGDIEFLNRVKEMWIVRCIERDHEEDGVKFWLFNSSKKKDGVYDKIMNLANRRAEAAAKKGNKYSIFDLSNGLDLDVTLTRTSDNKTTIQIIDAGIPSPLSEDVELGEKWIHDSKQWNEVYTVKPYEYMEVIAMGGVPVFSKENNKYVDKEELDKLKAEAEQQRIEETLTEPTKDFSDIAESSGVNIIDGNDVKDDDEDDLPF